MKKIEFYSMMLGHGNNPKAVKHVGWTDGEFNYYRTGDYWYCIEPNSGLSVGQGETRAIARTFAEMVGEEIEFVKARPEWSKTVDQFRQAVEATEAKRS